MTHHTARVTHTPGPWRVKVDQREPFGGVVLVDVVCADDETVCEFSGDLSRSLVNANLIAAAPTMFDALERIRESCGDPIIENICKAAIAKAEGAR